MPFVPCLHPFVERLIRTDREELLDRLLFWKQLDLERKRSNFRVSRASACYTRGVAKSSAVVMNNSRVFAFLASAVGLVNPTFVDAADIRGVAIVRDDASLSLSGRRVRLFGIYIPALNRSCGNSVQPLSCEEQRAARALNSKLSGFVHCRPRGKYSDGSLRAICWNDRIDLGAYLIERGFALATPEAPFEYHALEKVARSQRRGVWTFYGQGDY